jgi:hypothetical protein
LLLQNQYFCVIASVTVTRIKADRQIGQQFSGYKVGMLMLRGYRARVV